MSSVCWSVMSYRLVVTWYCNYIVRNRRERRFAYVLTRWRVCPSLPEDVVRAVAGGAVVGLAWALAGTSCHLLLSRPPRGSARGTSRH